MKWNFSKAHITIKCAKSQEHWIFKFSVKTWVLCTT